MKSKTNRRRSASEWSELVSKWKASGLSRDAFAAEHGLNGGTLGWWRTQLAKRGLSSEKKLPGKRRPLFTQVRVTAPEPRGSRMEVVTRGGHVIRVEGHVDAQALRAVLMAVEPC